MSNKLSMATVQVATEAEGSPEDSEERLRLSLSRIGTSKIRPAQGMHQRTHQLTQPVRRRFVRDGEVRTEYAGRSHDPSAPSVESEEALAALRAELAAEQAVREEADQALAAARATTRTLQTRVGHMELELQELRGRVARAAEEVAEANARLLQERADHVARVAAETAAEAAVRAEARAARTARRAAVVEDDEDDDEDDADAAGGPQPVKWWLKR